MILFLKIVFLEMSLANNCLCSVLLFYAFLFVLFKEVASVLFKELVTVLFGEDDSLSLIPNCC